MKKIITSLGMIVFAAAIVVGGTGAFFSDTETSTGNVFTAGALDLTVDSEAHYNGSICTLGDWDQNTATPDTYQWVGGNEYPVGLPCVGTWTATDLGAQTFFNYNDVKPGDEGENTISLHINNNPAWACVDVTLTKNDDMSSTEPELDGTGDVQDVPGDLFDGELAQNMKFAAWLDQGSQSGWQGKCTAPEVPENCDPGEGDNIWEGEPAEPLLFSNDSGPASDVLGGKSYPLAMPGLNGGAPMAPNQTNYIGLAWCAGTQTVGLNTITCDGSTLGNIVQTDSMEASIAFRVEQSRNNPNFRCAPTTEPTGPVVVSPNSPNGWEPYVDSFVGAGSTSFVADAGALGGEALRLQTVGNDSRVGWFNDNFNLNLAGVQISYDSKQVSALDVVNGNATIRLWIDTNGDNVRDDQLMYEPYFNYQSENPLNSATGIVPNTWQTWKLDGTNGKMWSNSGLTYNGKGAPGYATNLTIADVIAVYPAAKIVGISFSMGTYNPDQVVLVDNFVMNGVTYNFQQ